MNIIEGQQVRFHKVDYNLISYKIGTDFVTLHVKKQVNCRVCKELDLEAEIVNGSIDWDTLVET